MSKLFLFCYFILLSIQGFSNENLFLEILENQPDSIRHYSAGKVYLKAERISPSKAGIFLRSGTHSIPLKTLHSHLEGCYIVSSIPKAPIVWFEVKCKNCSHEWTYMSGIQENCPRCGSPP